MTGDRAPFYTILKEDVVAQFEPKRPTFMFSQYGEPREVVGYIVCNIDDENSVETETFLVDHAGFLHDKDNIEVFHDKCERFVFETAYDRYTQINNITIESFERQCRDLGFTITDDYDQSRQGF